jgi:hypothetical protein
LPPSPGPAVAATPVPPPATAPAEPAAEPAPALTRPPSLAAASSGAPRLPPAPAPALPRTAPPATRPAPAAEAPESDADASVLDAEPEQPAVDGVDAGRRLADSFSSGRSSPGYGSGARFKPRERSPRSLTLMERPAVATMRYVIDAQEAYQKKHGRYGNLKELAGAGMLLDVPVQQLAFLRKSYRFEMDLQEDGFRILAKPTVPGARPFVGDDTGIIRPGLE